MSQSTLESSFLSSPFVLTATADIAQSWAGRAEVLKQIDRLCRRFTTRPDSSLDVIWANFGSGKTHTLHHIAYLLSKEKSQSVTVYVEVPEQLRNFIDIFRVIGKALPWEEIAPKLLLATDKACQEDVRRAARALIHGNSVERAIAKEWLCAGRPHLRDLKSLTGITARIEDDAAALEILSDIVKVLSETGTRLVLLMDEFQRMSVIPDRNRRSLLSNLRTMFSRNGKYFSVILAATTRFEKSALALLPQELRTILGMRPAISLPEMSPTEAAHFVLERFRSFRPRDFDGSPFDPIGEIAVKSTIEFILKRTGARLTPRTLLQALATVFDEGEFIGFPLTEENVTEVLSNLTWPSSEEVNE